MAIRVRFQIEGGIAYFPALAEPIQLNSKELDEGEADILARKVEDADFFHLPERVGGQPGAADYRQYIITVEQSGRRHTVEVVEPVDDKCLKDLIDYLREMARTRRSGRQE